MPGAQCTRSLVCEDGGQECTRVFTASSPDQPGIPARNGVTAYTALSLVTGFLATIAPGNLFPAT
jgi:hypothetical protein